MGHSIIRSTLITIRNDEFDLSAEYKYNKKAQLKEVKQ